MRVSLSNSLPIEGWEIQLVGLINRWRILIHAEDFLGMEQVEYEMVPPRLGMGRSQYPDIGALLATVWSGQRPVRGVPLFAVLQKDDATLDSQAK